ncbi:MAG: CopD family protein [Gammaproteobacteria bacterium]|nr:CopD family protein [Gammaproteobacteria bacterium]
MTLNSIYNLLHVLAAVLWVGGMIFAHAFLRPVAVSQLEPPHRLKLWKGVFERFFPFVWLSVILLPVTGFLMVYSIWQGMATAPLYIHLMAGLGILMILIYLYVYFVPYKKLSTAIIISDWPAGGEALAKIRFMVGVNIILGLIVVIVASGGRYL